MKNLDSLIKEGRKSTNINENGYVKMKL
jgi:hypothetical protein